MVLLAGISLGYASLLLGLTKGEDSYTTLDGSVREENYLPATNVNPVIVVWFMGLKVCGRN
jgi:hypothetical protein